MCLIQIKFARCVCQVALGVFHILLGQAIQSSSSLDTSEKAIFHMLNIAGTIMVLFFAFISFFNQKELLTTKLGKSVVAVIILIYFSRAFEEFVFSGFDALIFSICIFVGLLYLIALFVPKQKPVSPS